MLRCLVLAFLKYIGIYILVAEDRQLQLILEFVDRPIEVGSVRGLVTVRVTTRDFAGMCSWALRGCSYLRVIGVGACMVAITKRGPVKFLQRREQLCTLCLTARSRVSTLRACPKR
jgi:hypothetical protein